MERLGRITTSLPDLPIDRRMTYGAMRRAIVGLPVTVSSAILPDGLWGLLRRLHRRNPHRPATHVYREKMRAHA